MPTAGLPKPQAAIADRTGLPTREWYSYFLQLRDGGGLTPAQQQQLDDLAARVTALEDGGAGGGSIQGVGSIAIQGAPPGIIQISLEGDTDSPGNTWYYGTGPDGTRTWYSLADGFAITTDLTKSVDGGTGVTTFGLNDLSNSGTGTAIYKTTRDAKGRTSGQVTANTDDLPESGTPTNQWFTPARVRAVVLTGLSTATNAVITAADTVLSSLGKLQAQITGLPKVLSGTYAARPAATAVTAGTTYTATDVRESYTSNGAVWALVPGAGVVLGAAERTTPFSTTSASLVDIPGMSTSFIVGERSFVAEFGADVYCNGANTDVMVVVLVIDGVSSAQLFCSGSIKSYNGMSRQILVSGKTPGTTVTCKLQCFVTGGSTANVFGDPADKMTLYARNS